MKTKETIKVVGRKVGSVARCTGKWTWQHKRQLVVYPLAVIGAITIGIVTLVKTG